MRVVLRSEIKGVGRAGDVKDVADGYARNFLIPRGLATEATPAALRQVERERDRARRKQERERQDAERLAAKLAETTLAFRLRSGAQGRTFGSVTNRDIAERLAAEGVEIDRTRLHLEEPLRSLGTHRVEVRLHPAVRAQVTVRIEAER